MRTLVFITSHFPYGSGEEFIETEFPYLENAFDNVFIISQDRTSTSKRDINPGIKVFRYRTSTSFPGFFNLPFLALKNFRTITQLFNEEKGFRKKTGYILKPLHFYLLFKKIIKAIQLKDSITKILSAERIDNNIVFYSYWLKTGAHAISMLEYPGSIRISRSHNSDLYEEKTISGYLPLLFSVSKRLDSIFFISENGRTYLKHKLNIPVSNFKLSYLGIKVSYIPKQVTNPAGYIIVSCSNIIDIKRLDLIIESLALTNTDRKITWLHFGDGILREKIQKLAEVTFSGKNNFEYRFMGQLPNNKLLEFYNTSKIDLFLNASLTEGIPVSMMEAQSAGIPIIATNVGGVSELVVDGTGFLIEPDFKPIRYAHLIEYFLNLPDKEIQIMRNNAYNNWKSRFNADKNFSGFVEDINAIFASRKQQNS